MKTRTWLAVLMLVTGAAVTACAESLDAIQQRMKTRLPVIEKLKEKGVLGENNRGYVEFVGSQKENDAEVQAENQDRKSVYQAIAQKTGTTDEQVGRRRAQKIAENAPPGSMVQDPNGQWSAKSRSRGRGHGRCFMVGFRSADSRRETRGI